MIPYKNGNAERGPSSATRADLPPPEEWPQRPLFVRWAPWLAGGPKGGECMRVNSRGFYAFETEHLVGHLHLAVRDATVHDERMEMNPWAPGERFHGKKRRFVCTTSVRFKKEGVSMDDLELGLIWERNVVPPKGIGLGVSILEKFSPGLRTNMSVPAPENFVVNNLCLAGADDLHTWAPGQPEEEKFDIMNPVQVKERWAGHPPPEGAELPNFKGMRDRSRWMGKSGKDGVQNCSKMQFDKNTTYTWDFYTHALHLDKFEGWFPLGITSWVWDFSGMFAGQPWPIVMRLRSTGEILGAIEVWHENCLRHCPPTVLRPPGKRVTFAEQVGYKEPRDGQPPPSPGHDHDRRLSVHSGTRRASGAVWRHASGGVSPPRLLDPEKDKDQWATATFLTAADDVSDDDVGCVEDDDGDPEDAGEAAESSSSRSEDAERAGDASPTSGPAEWEEAIVLWQGKRLHQRPASKSSWAKGGKGSVPQGAPVLVKERTHDGRWTRVATAGGVEGWIRSRYLAPRPSTAPALSGLPAATLCPTVAQGRGGTKRLRQQGQNKAKFYGPRLAPGMRVYVLTLTPAWALVLLPDSGAAGWLRRQHIELSDDSEVEPFTLTYGGAGRTNGVVSPPLGFESGLGVDPGRQKRPCGCCAVQ